MKAIEYLEEQKFGYDHFTELTSTGINPDNNNIAQFAEDYHQAKLNLLTIPVVSQHRELLIDFVKWFETLSAEELVWYDGKYAETFMAINCG